MNSTQAKTTENPQQNQFLCSIKKEEFTVEFLERFYNEHLRVFNGELREQREKQDAHLRRTNSNDYTKEKSDLNFEQTTSRVDHLAPEVHSLVKSSLSHQALLEEFEFYKAKAAGCSISNN